ERIFIRQAIKSFKSPAALAHACVGSLTWTLLAIITFMSGMLTLLYWRQRRYYVEHFIFLLHFHTGALLVFTLGFLLIELDLADPMLFAVLVPLAGLGMFFGLYRYYGQGIGRTFVKWSLFSLLYLISTVVFFIIGMVVVFAIY
ncbi:MAG: hypothetical protein ABIQ93_15520, partial [Saprospiraceae bacterium]